MVAWDIPNKLRIFDCVDRAGGYAICKGVVLGPGAERNEVEELWSLERRDAHFVLRLYTCTYNFMQGGCARRFIMSRLRFA